jgi:PhoH-like ATPase
MLSANKQFFVTLNLKNMAEDKIIYVLDLYSFKINPNAIMDFEEHDVVVPMAVTQELGKLARSKGSQKIGAKLALKLIRSLRKNNHLCEWTKINGDSSGSFMIKKHDKRTVSEIEGGIGETPPLDLQILAVVKELVKEYSKPTKSRKVVLITNDDDLFIKADALSLNVQEFRFGRVKLEDEGYKGFTVIDKKIPAKALTQLRKTEGMCNASLLPGLDKIANHYYVFKSKFDHEIVRFSAKTGMFHLLPKNRSINNEIYPKNIGQQCLWDALMNPDIKLVTVKGEAGTGKSLCAFATAINSINDPRSGYKKIVFSKQIISLNDKDMGFLPGTAEEKLAPYLESMDDSLAVIGEADKTGKVSREIGSMKKDGRILPKPLAFIRGTSKRNLFYIVDEVQNLTPLEVKTIMTRLGTNCKLVLLGDVSQIDVDYLDNENNGLTYTIEHAKGRSLVAHITLTDGERGELTDLANEIF